jgi:hypothetical protein
MKKSLVLVIKDARLERVRVTFPSGLTVAAALEAGMLIGGSEFVDSEQLRVVAEDRLAERGIEFIRSSHRGGSLAPGLRTASRAREER